MFKNQDNVSTCVSITMMNASIMYRESALSLRAAFGFSAMHYKSHVNLGESSRQVDSGFFHEENLTLFYMSLQ
jgi:hypothetical protein